MSYSYITSTGIISYDSSTLKTEVESEWTDSLNAPYLNTDSETIQGTLIAAETLSRQLISKNNAELANVINPNYSYGTFLDGIGAFLGITRGADAYTTGVGVVVTGNEGTEISAGSRVVTATGNIFTVDSTVTIGSSLSGVINITSATSGSIELPSGSLTIKDGINGWGSATVATSTVVTLGTSALTDSKFKTKRRQRLAAQGIASIGAIQAAVLGVDNVSSVNVVENVTGETTDAINGVTFTKGNAVWICAYGTATDVAIAQAIWNARGGMPFDYGATGQGTQIDSPDGTSVTDSYSGVAYNVKFVRATEKTAYVKIVAKQGTSTGTAADIVETVVDYGSGEVSGIDGLEIGTSLSSYEIAGAVVSQFPGVFISSVLVALTDVGGDVPADSDYSDLSSVSPWEIAIISTGNVSVSLS